jgi:hypothetical protein
MVQLLKMEYTLLELPPLVEDPSVKTARAWMCVEDVASRRHTSVNSKARLNNFFFLTFFLILLDQRYFV